MAASLRICHIQWLAVCLGAAMFSASASAQSPTVEFKDILKSVKENGITLKVEVVLDITSSQTVTVQWKTQDGPAPDKAQAPDDFTPGEGTLIFPAGTKSQTITVSIIDDPFPENTEFGYLILSNPTNATLGISDQCTFSIEDNDGTPPTATVAFDSPSWTVNEYDGTATISVTLTGTPSGPVSVTFSTKNGSATEGSDYVPVSGTLTWLASEAGTSKSFVVPIVDDIFVESIEDLKLALSLPVNAILGSQAGALLTIVDDDAPCP